MDSARVPEPFRGLLLRYRGRTGLTQRDLALRAGVNRRSVQDWEAGLNYPTAERLRTVIEVLLEAGGLTTGQEADEARQLWATVQRAAPRMHMPFDEGWFARLLAAQAALTAGRAGAAVQTVPIAEPVPGVERDWGEAPDTTDFVGRGDELARLQHWVLDERCRLVAILGMGGIGKTRLAARMAHDLASSFDRLFWRSLRDALPVSEWLAGAIGFLSDQQVVPPSADSERILVLLRLLRERRCLLVLDNFETLFEPEGRYRAGLAGYGRLLQAAGQTTHVSCLVLTSREAPPDWSALGGGLVRTLELGGLGISESQDLLSGKQLAGDDAAWADLTTRYGGNGLALNVVGATIRQVFAGDIGAFLSESGPETLFGSIKRLLADQIERSSPVEQHVLRMLAVEREPMSVAELIANLRARASRGALLESITALRGRSLVERVETAGAAAFTLQSVVLEYVTDRLVYDVTNEVRRGQPVQLMEHPLVKAQAKEYVRQAQERLIAEPILQRLESEGADVESQLLTLLDRWRNSPVEVHGYGPGNVVNLVRVRRGDLRGLNLARLGVRQAYLAGVEAQDARLAGAHLIESVLAESFIYPIRLALSANGALLLAGASSGQVWLWRVSDHTPLLAVRAHQGPVHGVAISSHGQLLASAGEDGAIRVWSFNPASTSESPFGRGAATSGHLVAALHGHDGAVLSVAMSPAGDLLVSGGLDGTVRVWDPRTGQLYATLGGHTGPVHGVALTADGQLLASCSQDGTVRQWFFDIGGGSATGPLSELRGHSGAVRSVALSADGQVLVSGGLDGTTRLWAPTSGQLQAVLSDQVSGVWGVSASADGRLVASANFDGTTRLWQTTSCLPLVTLQGHSSGVRDVTLSADGLQVATCSWDGSIRVWEATSGRRLATMRGITSGVWDIALSPDAQVLVSGSSDETVRVWAALDGRLLSTLRGHTAGVRCVALNVDRRLIASGGLDGTVRLWSLHGERLIATLHGHTGPVYAVKFSADAQLLVSGSEDGTLRLWSLGGNEGRLLATLRGHTGGLRCVSISLDGLLVASCSWDGTARLWDLPSGRPLARLDCHTVYAVALSPDKRLLATGGEDGIIRVWEVDTGEVVVTLEGSTAGICGVDWTADGQRLASGTSDGTIRLWDVPGARLQMTLEGHTDVVRGVALAAEGRLLASGSHDGTLRVWDTGSGRCVRVMRSDRTYERVDITGLTGVTSAQRTSLLTLGAIDYTEVPSR